MLKKIIFLVTLFTILFLVMGCANDSTESETMRMKYSKAFGATADRLIEGGKTYTGTPQANILVDNPMFNYVDIKDTTNFDTVYYLPAAFAYFFQELYKGDDFPITEEVVKVDLSGTSIMKNPDNPTETRTSIEELNDTLLRVVKAEDGWLYSDVHSNGGNDEKPDYNYLRLAIKYDFETSILYSFDMYFARIEKATDVLNDDSIAHYYMKEDGKIMRLEDSSEDPTDTDYEDAKDFIADSYRTFIAASTNAEHVGDYSTEYCKGFAKMAYQVYGDNVEVIIP